MSTAESSEDRRRRLLVETQGRRLDEAYLHGSIRDDLQTEAADADPDSIVTPEMLDQIEEYMDEIEGAGVPPGVLSDRETSQSRAFFSTDAVIIVPGFLASSLSDTRRGGLGLIWVSRGLYGSNRFGALRLGAYDGHEADLNPDVRIISTGGLPLIYDVLRLGLEALRYTTSTFGVDWRKDLEIAARGLRDRIKELGGGSKGYPIHLVAHSQGAMVARRALQLLKDDLGQEVVRRIVKHLVLLGPANAGSFSAALAISGDHESLPMLRKLTFEPTGGFSRVFATMSGLYQLMPWDASRLPSLGDPEHAVGRPEFWRGKADFDEARLNKYYGWARSIDTAFFNDRTSVILGDYEGYAGLKTPAGVAFGPDGHLAVTEEYAGDGTVPHCNAVLPGTATYMVAKTDHPMLPTYRNVVQSVRLILNGNDPTVGGWATRMPDDPRAPEYHR
ncbi:esterase/lipase family protein [Tautonia plasticadhaerens]|uniref:Alpha/beta hydrolase family protein n=1 Tax=Tautonia plasticadhaerens TaxID=2527974 RepID=A0A518H9C0_9BACT|nr:alpha/beta fold hydrolase [Tautonia plasticadhaerens]QDV37458.1 Alpha/beta hydrolase family protein [Tautonia plasticadhaerens]